MNDDLTPEEVKIKVDMMVRRNWVKGKKKRN